MEVLWRFYFLAPIATHEAELHAPIVKVRLILGIRLRIFFGVAPVFDPLAHLETNTIVSAFL
jgi:hypothetical protein